MDCSSLLHGVRFPAFLPDFTRNLRKRASYPFSSCTTACIYTKHACYFTVFCAISDEPPRTRFKKLDAMERRMKSLSKGGAVNISDVISNNVNILGWRVIVQSSGKLVGTVEEIIQFSTIPSDDSVIKEYVLRIVDYSYGSDAIEEKDSEEGEEEDHFPEFLVPFVSPIIISINSIRRILVINPPKGLLELGYRKMLLRKLEPELIAFCQQFPPQNTSWNRSLRHTDSQNAGNRSPFSQFRNRPVKFNERYMPTRRQLSEAGRHDLIELIMSAGGFLTTAQSLGLRANRRPAGFWDDLRNLDSEIEWFVATSWIEKYNPQTEQTCYYNTVTFETRDELPDESNISVTNTVPISLDSNDVCTAAMPRIRNVLEAKRYDLHNAIVLHGGYKSVAIQLGRQVVPKDSLAMLEFEIQNFMEKHSLSKFPSLHLFKQDGRRDLLIAIRRCGGVTAVADYMGLRPSKQAKGHWDFHTAVFALREYMASKVWQTLCLEDDMFDVEDAWKKGMAAGMLKLPTHQELREAKRHDLRYAFQKFGQKKLAKELGLIPNEPHRTKKKQKKNNPI